MTDLCRDAFSGGRSDFPSRPYYLIQLFDNFNEMFLARGSRPVSLEIMAFQYPGGGKPKHQAPKW